MHTLLLRLEGPMQSWGTTSRFDQRDTCKEPSKSGVIGIIAAAMGIDRNDWIRLEPLTRLKMGVRHDRSGVIRKDYQTAGCAESDRIIKADGGLSKDGVVSERYYLADASFLVGLEGDDKKVLKEAWEVLKNPQWVLGLGRKAYLPSKPIYLEDGLKENTSLKDALLQYPWKGRVNESVPRQILCSFESEDRTGRMVMDQLLSSFAVRKFGSRFVASEWLQFDEEVVNVSA
jgi:CRISPR system Cascade subunit CasD